MKHWMAWLWLAASACAGAETLRVEGLYLTPTPEWRRGDPRLEQEDGVYLLEHAGGVLRAALPRHPTPTPHGEAAFQEQLRRKWLALHGANARIEWREAAGARWQVCEHPSRDGSTRVQQWVSARDGLAYAAFFFLPADAEEAPAAIAGLLQGARWGEAAAPGWRRLEAFHVRPDDLAAVMDAENRALGEQGMVTGLGVETRGNDLEWFLEGFLWRTPPDKTPFRHQGRLSAASAAATQAWDLCAPRPALELALQRLRLGEIQGVEALAATRPQICPPGDAATRGELKTLAADLERQGLLWRRVRGQRASQPDAPAGRIFLPLLGVYSVYSPD